MAYPVPTTDITDQGNPPGSGPLRPGGQPAKSVSPTGDEHLPSTKCLAAKRQAPSLTVVRDLWAGNERVKACAQTYLPQAPREDAQDYRVRLQRATLYNVFRNTVIGLMGYGFREPPKLQEDVPAQLQTDWENIDLAGTHGDVFARDVGTDATTTGHAAILVDYPAGEASANYSDDLAKRPYWVPLTKDQLLSWRTTIEEGRTVLTQLVIEEQSCVPVGTFGDTLQTRYRVFTREKPDIGTPVVRWQLLEIAPNKAVVVIDQGDVPTQDEIPVAEIVTAGRRALFDSDPPFLDLAHLNLAHYRQWSDYDSSIHMTCVPLLFTAGFLMKDEQGKDIPVGPNTGLNSPHPDGKAAYVTHSGESLDQVRRSLEDLENRMAALGLAALATQKRAAETATAKAMDKGATDSALAVTMRGIQDGLERAMYFHARYYGLEDGGSVEMNADFVDMVMDAAVMTAWGTLAQALNLPPRVVIEALIAGGRLPEDTDVDELEREMVANAQADADRKAEELRMQVEMKAKARPVVPGTEMPPIAK